MKTKYFNVMAVGDVVGPTTVEYIKNRLWKFRQENDISLVVLNAENACVGNGLDSTAAKILLASGADVLTSGNHIWRKNEIRSYLDQTTEVLRPANYPASSPGNGYVKYSADGKIFLIMNVLGVIYMEPLDCPFTTVEKILDKEKGNYDYAMLDIHAEATSEKIALARYFDGRINVIFGTHTHVTTADEQVLPEGTGYITDLGMCGPIDSTLGIKNECILEKLKNKLPVKFEIAGGEIEANCTVFTIDEEIQRVVKVRRVKL